MSDDGISVDGVDVTAEAVGIVSLKEKAETDVTAIAGANPTATERGDIHEAG